MAITEEDFNAIFGASALSSAAGRALIAKLNPIGSGLVTDGGDLINGAGLVVAKQATGVYRCTFLSNTRLFTEIEPYAVAFGTAARMIVVEPNTLGEAVSYYDVRTFDATGAAADVFFFVAFRAA